MKPSILYVVLRGEFALYTDPDNTIHALAPNLPAAPPDPGHEYRAGGWPWPGVPLPALIPQGTSLSLRGADPTGAVNIEVNQPLPKIGVKKPNPAPAYCQITLPPPVRLIPGIKEDAQFVRVNVHNPGTPAAIPASPAVISVLVYEFSGALPQLLDSAGNVFCTAVPTKPGFAVIHIIASGIEREKKLHAQKAFKLAAALLGANADIDWDDQGVHMPGAPVLAHAPQGLTDEEVNLPWYMVRTGVSLPAFKIGTWFEPEFPCLHSKF